MYNYETKTVHCNNYSKVISTAEKVWRKWKFPPKVTVTQIKPMKELEFENTPLICLGCSDEFFRENLKCDLIN